MTTTPKEKNKTVKPLSLRLNFEQRAKLEQDAGGLPISTYIKLRLFGKMQNKNNTRLPRPVKDKQDLARILALLGQSEIASNLRKLADANRSGSLTMDEEASTALFAATQHISEIRMHLMLALGLRS